MSKRTARMKKIDIYMFLHFSAELAKPKRCFQGQQRTMFFNAISKVLKSTLVAGYSFWVFLIIFHTYLQYCLNFGFLIILLLLVALNDPNAIKTS